MRVLIMTICLLVVFVGACHAQQNWLEVPEIPFVVDPNTDNYIVAVRVEAEPAAEIRVEQMIETHIWPVAVTFTGLPVWARMEGAAVFMTPTAQDVGVWYWDVIATDEPPFYIDPISVTGTWAVDVVPKNVGPVFVPFVR